MAGAHRDMYCNNSGDKEKTNNGNRHSKDKPKEDGEMFTISKLSNNVVKSLKNRKTAGSDKIIAEMKRIRDTDA